MLIRVTCILTSVLAASPVTLTPYYTAWLALDTYHAGWVGGYAMGVVLSQCAGWWGCRDASLGQLVGV